MLAGPQFVADERHARLHDDGPREAVHAVEIGVEMPGQRLPRRELELGDARLRFVDEQYFVGHVADAGRPRANALGHRSLLCIPQDEASAAVARRQIARGRQSTLADRKRRVRAYAATRWRAKRAISSIVIGNSASSPGQSISSVRRYSRSVPWKSPR